MSEFLEINIVNSIVVFTAAVIPLYLSIHLDGSMKKLTLLLSIFAIIHALYHTFEAINFEELAEDIVEPLSIIVLIFFGLLYLRIRSARRISA